MTDKNIYLETLEELLKDAQQEYKWFVDAKYDPDPVYMNHLYSGVREWALRVSQLKEKIADAKFHTREKK